ncbi:MAG: hypothetical protein V1918_02730 [Planctomycetota bacterium]
MNVETLVTLIAMGAMVGFGLLVVYAFRLYERQRGQAWEALAKELGFAYLPEDPALLHEYSFPLFEKGMNRRASNVLRGEARGIEVVLADYRYAAGGEKGGSTSYQQSICIVKAEALGLPLFSARPAQFIDRFMTLVGQGGLLFEEDPDFSEAFIVQGEEEPVRELFTARARNFFREHEEEYRRLFLSLEGAGGALLLVSSRRLSPKECLGFLRIAFDLLALWAQPGAA